jgi:hypothetical protein
MLVAPPEKVASVLTQLSHIDMRYFHVLCSMCAYLPGTICFAKKKRKKNFFFLWPLSAQTAVNSKTISRFVRVFCSSSERATVHMPMHGKEGPGGPYQPISRRFHRALLLQQ